MAVIGLLSFWPPTGAEIAVNLSVLVVVAPATTWVLRVVGLPKWPDSNDVKYFEWERDRVLAVAKGTAAGAVGFLTTLVVALLKNEIKADVSGLSILGCLAGALGLLMFASQMSLSVRADAALTAQAQQRARSRAYRTEI